MIRFLTHTEIDKSKWDLCISGALQPSLYALSWYLDAVSPQWCALINDDYSEVMPLCERRKWGISYLYQPAYTQLGGVFSLNKGNADVDPFLEIIKKRYRLVEINLPSNNQFSAVSFPVKDKINQFLQLRKPYELLSRDFHRNHRRNISRAEESGFIVREIEAESFLNFKIKNQSIACEDISVLPAIIRAADERKVIHCYAAINGKGEIKAANMIISKFNRLYLLASENTDEGKEKSLMFGILNHVFKQFADQNLTFDFEGSGITGVNLFNAGFGAKEELYHHITINRLPFPLNYLKR